MTAIAESMPSVGIAFVPEDDLAPLDRYLAEQQRLTAVERFSARHDELAAGGVASYEALLPQERPTPGRQYAFSVDLDACTGCKACVTACHSLNGLDTDEAWRSVGLLVGGSASQPFQQTVTTACHHCLSPACMQGCPVNAYEKDPLTGIVRHLDDQCIGCSYCTLTCPYEVPAYNRQRGIVRKCDMCSDRLAAGEAPACVQACPNEAISITLVDTEAVVREAAAGTFLPTAPSPDMTIPTTRYRSARGTMPSVLAADTFRVGPAKAHPPLVWMLVLTQLSVGALIIDLVMAHLGGNAAAAAGHRWNAVAALGCGLLALGMSVLHLGRPRYAFRAVIGIASSWVSREIVAFCLFAVAAVAYAVSLWQGNGEAAPTLGTLAGLVGLAGVGCSAMVYAATRRRWWRLRHTAVKFALTTGACGLAAVNVSLLLTGDAAAAPVAALLAACAAVKLAWEAAILAHLREGERTELGRTALLLTRDLAGGTRWRWGLGLSGGVMLPLTMAAGWAWPALGVSAMGLLVAGELVERSQFFTASAAARMPGDR